MYKCTHMWVCTNLVHMWISWKKFDAPPLQSIITINCFEEIVVYEILLRRNLVYETLCMPSPTDVIERENVAMCISHYEKVWIIQRLFPNLAPRAIESKKQLAIERLIPSFEPLLHVKMVLLNCDFLNILVIIYFTEKCELRKCSKLNFNSCITLRFSDLERAELFWCYGWIH